MLTPKEITIATQLKGEGYTTQEILEYLGGVRAGVQSGVAIKRGETGDKQPLYTFDEAKTDVVDMFKGIYGATKKAGESIVQRGQTYDPNISTGENVARNVVGAGADIFRGIGGVIGEAFTGAGKVVLPQKAEDYVAQKTGEVAGSIMQNEGVQNLMQKYESLSPEMKAQVDNILGYTEGLGAIISAGAGTKTARELTNTGIDFAKGVKIRPLKEVIKSVDDEVAQLKSVASKTGVDTRTKTASGIMDRVARINPSDIRKFEQVTGEKPGEFLVKRGIYGDEEKIITELYKEFERSKNLADEALASIDGIYTDDSLAEALDELLKREVSVSRARVPSRDLQRVNELYNKHMNEGGLTMSEINETKRLFERNVRTDYLSQKNFKPESIVTANNIDSAMREFQMAVAKAKGLKNLAEINKNTQANRMLADALWKKVTGQQGNNALSLTDAVLVSGGDVSSIGMLLTRKTLGSKSIQAKIAELLAPEATVKQIQIER